jgi:dUTP pyrophosphatase
LGFKKGLQIVNGIGVVDRDYSGPEDEIFIVVRNFTDAEVKVAKGERLAQGIFLPVNQVEWEEITEPARASRGGFGITGGYQ